MPRNNKGEETVGFGVRLSKSDRQWLEEMALMHGCEVSQLIRHAVETLRQYVRAHRGHLITPIKITSLWQQVEAEKINAMLDAELANEGGQSAEPSAQTPSPSNIALLPPPGGIKYVVKTKPPAKMAEDPPA